MNNYMVNIRVTFGEYTKNIQSLVTAETEESAASFAIALEVNTPRNFEWGDESKTSGLDSFGELHYSAERTKEVEEEDMAILQKYMPVYSEHDYADLMDDMPEAQPRAPF